MNDPLRLAALSNLMVTMRAIEMRTLKENAEFGIFINFGLDAVKNLVLRMSNGERIPVQGLPSWTEVTGKTLDE